MSTPERRRLSRVTFHHGARLSIAGTEYACEVLDLSLKGALLRPGSTAAFAPGTPCELELVLDDGEHQVRMEGLVAHCERTLIGLACRSIDLDSVTVLRRLIELNLGDAALLERDLHALVEG
jgi:hypothetical protein